MKIDLNCRVFNRPLKTAVKMVIDYERYAIVESVDDSLIAVKFGDEIVDNKAPFYFIWNVIRKNNNEWQVERAMNGTAEGFVEVY